MRTNLVHEPIQCALEKHEQNLRAHTKDLSFDFIQLGFICIKVGFHFRNRNSRELSPVFVKPVDGPRNLVAVEQPSIVRIESVGVRIMECPNQLMDRHAKFFTLIEPVIKIFFL